MAESSLGERITAVETNLKSNNKRLEKLENTTNLIHKMNVLLEVQTDMNKNQQAQIETFQNVVKGVNENLTNISYNQEKLSDKLDMMAERVDKMEDANKKEREDDTISIQKIVSSIFKWLAYSLPVIILLAYLSDKFGW